MDTLIKQAKDMIISFKGESYTFGANVLDQVGSMTAQLGKRALVVSRLASPWLRPALDLTLSSLGKNNVQILGPVQGAAPNAPREDVYRHRSSPGGI
jgi:hypothetical protein